MPNDDKTVLPRSNKVYAKKEYWEKRFAEEESFEWLVSYDEVAPQLERYLPPNKSSKYLGHYKDLIGNQQEQAL